MRELPQESIRVPVETPPQQRAPDQAIARPSPRSDDEEDEEEQEGVVLPDPEKDDMMARRTRAFNTQTAAGKKAPVNRFLPVPGSAVHRNVAPLLPVSNPPLQSRLKTAEKRNRDRYLRRLASYAWFVPAIGRMGMHAHMATWTNTEESRLFIVVVEQNPGACCLM